MEIELLKKFRPALVKAEALQESKEERLEKEDVKLLIRDVLKEIEASRKRIWVTNWFWCKRIGNHYWHKKLHLSGQKGFQS